MPSHASIACLSPYRADCSDIVVWMGWLYVFGTTALRAQNSSRSRDVGVRREVIVDVGDVVRWERMTVRVEV